jgi:alkyl hydroperoxide reductase subunit AhpC
MNNIYCVLASSPVTSVKVQEPAPQFEGKAIIDGQIKDIKLSDFAGKYLVLFFYPLDL